ncbi:interferon kappa-like [Protobothrops mucrosquamatus]|uniref:interferon kappa-like n=1 Tax=Protobothrops mucrosquamatus TaxID=103944 RepID=UPI000775F8A1|nr:interferon kappa-like [Protobothrops mucrosquamatus]
MIMNNCCLYICIWIISFGGISSQNCNQLQRKLLKANQINFNLLSSNIGSTIPLQCIKDINFSFEATEKILIDMNDESQVDIAKTAVKEILQQIGIIFKQSHIKLVWPKVSLKDFHIGLDQQIKMLETCENSEVKQVTTSPRNQKLQLTRLRVKRYFQRLHDFLKNKNYNLCAWKIVQIHMKECFELINHYIQRIPSKVIVDFWKWLF